MLALLTLNYFLQCMAYTCTTRLYEEFYLQTDMRQLRVRAAEIQKLQRMGVSAFILAIDAVWIVHSIVALKYWALSRKILLATTTNPQTATRVETKSYSLAAVQLALICASSLTCLCVFWNSDLIFDPQTDYRSFKVNKLRTCGLTLFLITPGAWVCAVYADAMVKLRATSDQIISTRQAILYTLVQVLTICAIVGSTDSYLSQNDNLALQVTLVFIGQVVITVGYVTLLLTQWRLATMQYRYQQALRLHPTISTEILLSTTLMNSGSLLNRQTYSNLSLTQFNLNNQSRSADLNPKPDSRSGSVLHSPTHSPVSSSMRDFSIERTNSLLVSEESLTVEDLIIYRDLV